MESVATTEIWQRIEPVDLPEDVQQTLLTMVMVQSTSQELCGFIDDQGIVYPIKNVAETPLNSYEMDKEAMMKVIHSDTNIIGTYHSHPSGRPWPSVSDTESITHLYQTGCPWRYFIVTGAGVYEFNHKDRKPQ